MPNFGVAQHKAASSRTGTIVMGGAGELNTFRYQVNQAKNTKRITGAMRLVAAAKVRRA